jgi:hypothetical protein
MRHPRGSPALNRICAGVRTSGVPYASYGGGDWRPAQAENAVSRSLPAWPLRDDPFSGPPGGTALAAYPREKKTAGFEQGVLYGCGPAQVGFGATFPLLSSPHRLFIGRLSPEPLRLTHPEGVGQIRAPNEMARGRKLCELAWSRVPLVKRLRRMGWWWGSVTQGAPLRGDPGLWNITASR